ncbi:hypothetical protein N7493_011362 [Penicillium malachiteum]|uniref:Major facilitator superfamily (MFS) profile domain-containing protein n=1 Tax=Penicillium malachiteum TaxID=1324776 RepID=A0AAD6MR30_9EURO|nr:hypothetical protein N7493_011362 [Penicillium malachiteum]
MRKENQDREDENASLLGPRQSRLSLLHPQKPRLATFILSLCMFLLCGATSMVEIPLTQLMEDNLWDRYLAGIGRPDSLTDRTICKADEIQSKLAYLNTSFGGIESATGVLGRRPVLYLSATGTALYLAYDLVILKFTNILPIEYILLGPLFTLIGGGSTVINASLYSLASDLLPDTNMYATSTSQRGFEPTDVHESRAISYSMMAFGTLFGSSVGPVISSKLIEKSSPWLPMLIGSLTVPASMGLLIFLPEIIIPRDNSSKGDLSELGDTFSGTIKSQVPSPGPVSNVYAEISLYLNYFDSGHTP